MCIIFVPNFCNYPKTAIASCKTQLSKNTKSAISISICFEDGWIHVWDTAANPHPDVWTELSPPASNNLRKHYAKFLCLIGYSAWSLETAPEIADMLFVSVCKCEDLHSKQTRWPFFPRGEGIVPLSSPTCALHCRPLHCPSVRKWIIP